MFLEYMGLLGMGAEPAFSFEFISRIVLVLFSVLAMIFIGYKIKEGWGAVIAILICAFLLLYLNGLLPSVHHKRHLSAPGGVSLVFNPRNSALCLRLKTRSGLAGNQNLSFLDRHYLY